MKHLQNIAIKFLWIVERIKARKYIILFIFLLLLLPACKNNSSPTAPTDIINAPSNQYPRIESFTGPTSCKRDEPYTYRINGYDPDGEKVAFHFNIHKGDWSFTWDLGWSPYVNNHEWYEKSITWNFDSAGEYIICYHCRDEEGFQSG